MTEPLADASDRLVRTVDRLTDDELAGPSLLPGWSRAHVVAHLALNGEGLAGALDGVAHGESVPMYASSEARDDDIDELSGSSSADLRERLLAAVTRFAESAARLPDDRSDDSFPRVPDGPLVPAGRAAGMRWVEVEVHHTDLDAGYTAKDWPAEFCAHLLDSFTVRPPHWEPGFVADPDDASGTWELGTTDPDAPVVTGPLRDLVSWLTGRGDGEGLTSTSGELPTIGKW